MATKRRRKKASGYKTAAGGCKFGKVKTGKRKGQCLKNKRPRRKK